MENFFLDLITLNYSLRWGESYHWVYIHVSKNFIQYTYLVQVNWQKPQQVRIVII